MRTSIWDEGPYKGYAHDPQRQLNWFLDHAEAVKKQRIARGLSVDDPKQYGNWVADVENPAAQYRGRYQEHLAEARRLLAHSDPKRPEELSRICEGCQRLGASGQPGRSIDHLSGIGCTVSLPLLPGSDARARRQHRPAVPSTRLTPRGRTAVLP
jgi:hypothetical protein